MGASLAAFPVFELRGGWPIFFTILSSLLILFLMKNMHNCKKAVVPELRARSASTIALLFKPVFEQIATSIKPFFSFSPRKKLRVRFENGKNFSDSRGNRQANWNLDIFFIFSRLVICPALA